MASKAMFYDVKTRKKVKRPVLAKQVYGKKGKNRYALKAKTEDGRNLVVFCKQSDYDSADVPVVE